MMPYQIFRKIMSNRARDAPPCKDDVMTARGGRYQELLSSSGTRSATELAGREGRYKWVNLKPCITGQW
jgi:hypothetical protein